jgi:hypothetical protein
MGMQRVDSQEDVNIRCAIEIIIQISWDIIEV